MKIRLGNKKLNKSADASIDSVAIWELYQFATCTDWAYMIVGALCTMISGACHPYHCYIFGQSAQDFIKYATSVNRANITETEKTILQNELHDAIFLFSMTSVCLGFISFICQYISGVFLTYSSLQQIFTIRKKFLESTLEQDISWYDLNKTGQFASVFSENLTKIEDAIGEKVGFFFHYMTVFLTSFIWSFCIGWELTLVCMIPLPLSSIVMGIITWLSSKFSKKEMDSYSKAGSIANEVFGAIKTVVAFEGQNVESYRYDLHLEEAKKNNIKRNCFNGLNNGFLWFIVYGGCALSMWIGVNLLVGERLLPEMTRTYTAGVVLTIFFNTMLGSWNYSMGAPYLQMFGEACGAAAKVFNIINSRPIINIALNSGKKNENIKGDISFERIYFNYPSRPNVKILHGLSLNISAHETVAFVGNSGCGKSTSIQLLQRFYDPTKGQIKIDGQNIKDLNLSWLRSKIGVVSQEPILFATTIAENILYGNQAADQKEVEIAAKKAKVHDFIKTLPHGYDSVVGEQGAQLSGGQKQRIAIARALVRNPSILLLDEATSALDTTSEAEVQEALDSVSGKFTTIIIAHRLSTVRNADRIFVFSEGNVVEEGNYEDLIEKKGAFYDLVKAQIFLTNDNNQSNLEPLEDYKTRFERNASIKLQKFRCAESSQNVEENDQVSTWNIFEVLKMNSPEWYFIVFGCLTSIIIGAALPVYAIIVGDIIGILSVEDSDELLTKSALLCSYFLILGIVLGLAYFLQGYSFGVAGENLTLRVRSAMFKSILRQDIGWFDRKDNSVGSLCTKLSNDCSAVQGASGMPIGTLLNSISTMILSNVMAFYFQHKMALVFIAFFPLIFASIYLEQKIVQGNSHSREKKLRKSAGVAVEAIGNIKTVAALGCEKLFLERYIQELEPYIKTAKRSSHFRSFVLGTAKSLMYFAYAIGIGYGASLVLCENVNYNLVFKVGELVIVGSWALGTTFAFAPNFQKGLQAAGRIFTLLNRQPDVENIPNASLKELETNNIQFSGIHFSYPTRPDLATLKGLNLTIPENKTIALVGVSGCGKSTVIKLLERFYNPNAGEIIIDNTDIKILDIQKLRSNFGIVSQEPNLFDRTIAENIAYGDNRRTISMDEIVQVAKKANIHNFVGSLPQGYETPLGSKGAQLSGGQKQRIAIARALIRNPKILLLDEATSALDNESEKIVQEALDEAKKGRTCLIIAHRLTTVQDADLIYVLDSGRVVESGSHQDLIEKRGHYYNFYKLQSNF